MSPNNSEPKEDKSFLNEPLPALNKQTASHTATCTRCGPGKLVLEHRFHIVPFKDSF